MNAIDIESTGGDIVAQFLKSAGVTEVYGIPGGHTLGLNEGLVRSGIEFVTCRHEYGAGCAAAAYGRVKQRAGVALVTCGPGVTNAATAVAGALRDGNPMLLLSVNNRGEHIGWGDAQDADAVAVLASLAKWSVHVSRGAALLPTLRRAWRLAHSDRPGPVHVDIARDVAEEAQASRSSDLSVPDLRSASAPRPAAAALDAVIERLKRARQPVLWVGRGSLTAYHEGELAPLIETLSIPVISTFNAMEMAGAFGNYSFGVLSRVGTKLSRAIVEASDLVLCLGNSLNGVSTKRWSLKLPSVVQVDVRSDRINDIYAPALSICADAGEFCRDLAQRPELTTLRNGWREWLDACAIKRVKWRAELDAAVSAASTQPVSPLALMSLFARFNLDVGAHWCIDASNPGIWAHVLAFRNGARVLRPVNFSNMGFALGAGIGVARAGVAEGPVNVLIGDGSMGMSLGELETIKRLNLPLRIFVMNDSSLSNIRQEVTFKYRRNETDFDFTDVRFDRIAEGFGILGTRVDRLEDLETLLRAERPAHYPCLYDIVIDRRPSVWTDMV